MQDRSDTWKVLAETGTFLLNSIAVINGTEYTATSAPVISRGLFSDSLSVGNCTAASLSLSILTDDEIEKSAEVKIQQKLLESIGGAESEWLPAGTFYITSRTKDYSSGLLTLNCYDAMLKAQQNYFESEEDANIAEWPQPMSDVVTSIAERMGVEIDSRTVIRTEDRYVVTYPYGLTMMDVLGYIGAVHGGNWIITPEGRLRLISLATAPEDSSEDALTIIAVLSSLTTGQQLTISRVTIADEDGNSYTNGDDTGHELTISSNPYACQEICDDLYESLNGIIYNPYTANKTIYDPAAELGDPVLYNGLVYSFIAKEDATLGAVFQSNVSAPSNEELEDEYPYVSASTKKTATLEEKVSDLEDVVSSLDEEVAVSGMRTKQVTTEDGGAITYFYNAATLAESTGVIRISDQGIQFTASYTGDDDTTTWYGLDLSGDLLAAIISASGLTLGGKGNGNGILTLLDDTDGTIAVIDNSGLTFGDNFTVTPEGYLTAKGATLESATVEGVLTAGNGSKIGGFTVGDTAIYSNGHTAYDTAVPGVYIGTDYISLGNGGAFKVDSNGEAYVSNIIHIVVDSDKYLGGAIYFDVGDTIDAATIYYDSGILSFDAAYGGVYVLADYGSFFVRSTSSKIDSTLAVSGATTLSSTLAVSGAITAESSITLPTYGSNIKWNTTFGYIGFQVLSSGASMSIFTADSSQTWTDSVQIANEDGVRVIVRSDPTSAVGSGTKPVYVSSGGTVTASSSTVGDADTPVYLSSGTITKCTSIALKVDDVNGTSRWAVGSGNTDGQYVAALTSYAQGDATTYRTGYYIGVYAQWGTTGSTYATHTIYSAASDIRLKANIKDCEVDAMAVIRSLSVRQFDWKDSGVHQAIGFVADELEVIHPNFAFGGGYDENGDMIVKSVNEFYMLGYVVKGLQETDDEITALKAEIKSLKEQLAALAA